ncbi:MAG: hypothetical protein AAF706_03705, partial [Bacteroidota bacterium]
ASLPVPAASTPLDIAVYVTDAARLPEVCQQLAGFLGCSSEEALQLLTNNPPIVLGGVSEATANALGDRLAAEVMAVDPHTSLYTLTFEGADVIRTRLQAYLDRMGVEADLTSKPVVEHLTHEQGQAIWKQFNTTSAIKLINQDFQRFEVILTDYDQNRAGVQEALASLAGMPREVVDEVLNNLPIQVVPSISRAAIQDTVNSYQQAGLVCEARLISHAQQRLVIEEVKDEQKTRAVLSKFLPKELVPPQVKTPWYAPIPMAELVARYAVAALEANGCEVDYEDYEA